MRTREGSNPASTPCRRMKLLISRPAPTSRSSDSATSAATSTRRRRSRPRPEVEAWLPSFSTSCIDPRTLWKAGTRPNRIPVASATAIVKTSAVASRRVSASLGNDCAAIVDSTETPTRASATPSAAPTSDSTTLSVNICRISRPRLAPSAVRMPISRSRADARTSSRFATFVHAINSTRPTDPMSIRSAGLMSPTYSSSSGLISTRYPNLA